MRDLNNNLVDAGTKVIATIQRLLSSQAGPIVVAVDGGSGAGKSTLARLIQSQGEQEFPRGYLKADVLPRVPGVSPTRDGERLFEWLFADDDKLKTAWTEVRGQSPLWRMRSRD